MKLAALAVAVMVAGVASASGAAPAPAPFSPTSASVAEVLRDLARAEGLDVAPAPPCATLAEGLALHAARLGVAAPAAPAGLPPALARGLGCLLSGVHDANLAHDATFAGVPAGDLARAWELEEGAAFLAEGRDHRALLTAAIHLAERADIAIALLQPLARSPLPPIDLEPILRVDALGDTTHAREYAVIVDLAGNDLYDNHAGGVFFARAEPSSEFNAVEPGSAWMQFSALGSDAFIAPKTQDADLVLSAGLVIDFAGDDTYGVKRAPRLADLECGEGAAAFPGTQGEDVSHSRSGNVAAPRVAWVGTQGSGILGVGMLRDLAGNDVYLGRTAAQGAGHVMGVGVLHDAAGDDRYDAVRLAQGSALLGGVGLLLEGGGHDTYTASAPEGGIFNGDTRACDHVGRYAQGSVFDNKDGGGPPMAALLLERGGDDVYRADVKSQGFLQGIGFALLDDAGGNDRYASGDLSQGAAQGRPKDIAPPTMAGLAVLLDRAGDDVYVVSGRGQGFSTGATTETPLPAPNLAAVVEWTKNRDESTAVLADLAGDDAYAGAAGRADGAVLMAGVLGFFVDAA